MQRRKPRISTSTSVTASAGAFLSAGAVLAVCVPAVAEEETRLAELPEPMVFDLVHGLGVGSGAFEANVLALLPLDDKERGIDWAPEVEYAVADGFAIEFELGFDDSRLEAYKFATQFTFTESQRRQHGSQFIIEKARGEDRWELTGLYILGTELLDEWDALSMLGLRTTTGHDVRSETEVLANVSLFRDLGDRLVFGLENDLAIGDRDDWSLLVFPQLHYEISEFFNLQAGAGAEFGNQDTGFYAGFRLIYARPGDAPWR